MRSIIKIASVFALILTLTLSVAAFAQSCREWTMDEYNAKMADLQKREADAKAEMATLDKEIATLKDEIATAEKATADEWQAIYTLLGTDEAGVNQFGSDLGALEAKVDELSGLTPEELFQRRKEIDQLEEQLNGYKGNNIALLSSMQDKIAVIEGKISQLRASLPKAVYDEYTVVKGDYLWKIAGKEDIYSDPYQWIRIYTYNRDQIKDPDMIYPEQIFKIQRGVGANEYLVVKGDFLYKIAGKAEIFNDPTKWTKIYEANSTVIKDKNEIYPHQVLIIPE
ncbi:hypothetical protein B6D60_02990 [candidate division KSB1 bacterium 4484_87]|nr:MAG: hypothetical protein B6D60_02990 [candidate division KSB1 bacterium 4484_87]